MSELTTAARPYARAAFASATDKGEEGQWSTVLNLLAAVVHDTKVKKLLDDPKRTWEQRAELVLEICAGNLSQRTENFVRLLAERDRLALLPEIAALYQHYRSRAQGSIDAQVISAREMSESQLTSIADSLSRRLGKKVNITSSVDERLLGGAIVKAGDLVIDGSVKGLLDKLSSALN